MREPETLSLEAGLNQPFRFVSTRFDWRSTLGSAKRPFIKNIQVIDGAANARYSVFQATDEEFATIFADGRDIELVGDVIERVGEEAANPVLTPVWARPIPKREGLRIHGPRSATTTIDAITYCHRSARWTGLMAQLIKPSESCSRSTDNLSTPPGLAAFEMPAASTRAIAFAGAPGWNVVSVDLLATATNRIRMSEKTYTAGRASRRCSRLFGPSRAEMRERVWGNLAATHCQGAVKTRR